MKKFLLLATLLSTFSLMATSQPTVFLTVDGKVRRVTLSDNSATASLTELLKEGPIKINMRDYGGFEKVGALPQSFPTSNSQITTQPGDIMLYQGNQMVIFYGSNTWSYTPLGKIDDATASNVKEFLGEGPIELTVSLEISTGIEEMVEEANLSERVYDLNGRIVNHRPLTPGFYIIDGKKVLIQ